MGQYRNISRFTPNRSWEQIKRRNQIIFSRFWNWRWHRNDFHIFWSIHRSEITKYSLGEILKRIIDLVRAPWTSRDCSHPSATINQSRSNQVWNCQTAQLRRLEPLRSLVRILKISKFWKSPKNLRKLGFGTEISSIQKLIPVWTDRGYYREHYWFPVRVQGLSNPFWVRVQDGWSFTRPFVLE